LYGNAYFIKKEYVFSSSYIQTQGSFLMIMMMMVVIYGIFVYVQIMYVY